MQKTMGVMIAVLVLFMGCFGNSSTGPSGPDNHGWIVGESSSSGVTILHTTDGSAWIPQGDSLSLTGSELSSVSTVDDLTALAAGGLSNGYGVVIRTTDGGTTWQRVGSASQIPEANARFARSYFPGKASLQLFSGFGYSG